MHRRIPKLLAVSTIALTLTGVGALAGADNHSTVEEDTGRTVIFTSPGFNTDLIDDADNCRFWARNRDGRNMRPCTGEAPTCGEPIPFGKIDVIDFNEGSESPGELEGAMGDGSLVTSGFFRVPITTTPKDAQWEVMRRIAREGCDLLVVGDEEWITIRNAAGAGEPIRYLRVQWGTQNPAEAGEAQTAP